MMKTPMFLFLLLALSFAACTPAPKESEERADQEIPPLTSEGQQQYLEKGKAMASATFAELSGRLTQALARGGVQEAVQYCNVVAMPLVDSLSKANNATIRRSSLKVRNPADKPTPAERAILNEYHTLASQGADIKPRVQLLENGEVGFFAPIRIMPLCLQCHGKVGEDISREDYALIKALYPEDEATGYVNEELRGIWSIAFERTGENH